jgi:predicted ATPase
MLKKITVQGFKSIERQTIELGALNVLIGANGSGKSNLLSALSFFRASALGDEEALVKRLGGADRLLFHGKKLTKFCFFSCEEESFSYKQTLIPVAGDRLVATNGCLSISGSKIECSGEETDIDSLETELRNVEERYIRDSLAQGKLADDAVEKMLGEFPSAKQHIEDWRMYHLHDTSATAAVKSTCNIDDNRYLREDAANLAACLYWLKLKYPREYRQIVSIIQIAMPYLEDFVLEPLRRNERTIRLEWKQRNSDAYFDADSLSDGSLRFVALTTLLNLPEHAMPRLVVIDEPELGLHPLAIRLLSEMLDVASQQTQILVATQSVTLLDDFAPQDVIVAEHDGAKTTFNRLDEEKLKIWLDEFSLGELWEKNVLGGRP